MKKNNIKIYISNFIIFVIAITMILKTNTVVSQAKNNISQEAKIYCTATIENDFASNRIIVVMNQKESYKFLNYSVNDFSDVNIKKIKILNKFTKDELIRRTKTGLIKNKFIDGSNYRSIMLLELKTCDKQNVLDTIRKIEKRNDVLSVEPDYFLYSETTMPNDQLYMDDDQWGLNGENGINIPAAWEITTGSADIKVGVIDSGIDADHFEFVNNLNEELSRDFTLDYPYIPTEITDCIDAPLTMVIFSVSMLGIYFVISNEPEGTLSVISLSSI